MNPLLPSRRNALAMAAALAALGLAPRARAQGASITWLVGQPPGGTVDVLTRLVGRQVEQTLGQTVVVENRPGAAGALALQAAARAPKGVITLVTMPGPILASRPVPQIGKELTGVAMLARGPMVLVGTMATALPPTLEGLLAAVQKDPKPFAFGSSGNGTSQHLAGELMNQMAGTRILHVPCKGGGQAVTDVVGGQLPLAMLGITPVLPHIRSGRLRAYGVSTPGRSAMLPDVPTLAEAGLGGFDADQWFAVATAIEAPKERVAAINAAINKALASPDVLAAFMAAGVVAEKATPQQTSAFVSGDLARWLQLARQLNLPLE